MSKGRVKKMKKMKRYLPFYLMTLPAMLYLLVNNYIPMAGIFMAFQRVNFSKGMFGGQWVGLENFRFLFATSDAWIMTRNTILYNVAFLILSPLFGILGAICLNQIKSKLSKKLFQTLILLPYLMSMVVVSYLVYAILNGEYGLLNRILDLVGLPTVDWYARSAYWPFILTFVYIWHSIGFNVAIYLAAIVGISPDYYEAANLDGATKWQQIRYITLPFLKPTVITMTILGLGRVFRSDFGLFFQVPMDTGILYDTTQTIDTYVYRSLMQLGNIGMSAAAGFYQSVVGFIILMAANLIIKKIDKENAMF